MSPSWARRSRRPPRRFLALSLGAALLLACGAAEPAKLFQEGEEHWARGDYDRAVAVFNRIVEVFPLDEQADDALARLGDIHYLFRNRPDDALVYYQDLLRLHPGSPRRIEVRMKMAAIYRSRKNDCARATLEYQKVLEDDPPPATAAEAQYRIAACHYQDGEIGQAATEFQILLVEYPESAFSDKALMGLADCFYNQGRWEAAVRSYQRVVEESKDEDLVAEAWFGAASAHQQLGNKDEALNIYRRLVESYPNRAVVEERISRLEGGRGKATGAK